MTTSRAILLPCLAACVVVLAFSPSAAQSCPDADEDGWADCTVHGCDPTGLDCGDCDDALGSVHPGASESCNHRDDDCDGLVDESFPDVTSVRVLQDTSWGGNFLGRSLAVLGDVDGDGIEDLAVGYPGDHADGSWRGSVQVVSGADRSILCRAYNDDTLAGGELGSQVVALGDVDDDEVPDFAATAPKSDAVAYDAGEAIVFSGADCSVIRHLRDPAGASQDMLGEENAIGRVDLDGDGVPEVVVGAARANTAGLSDAGKALVFSVADGSVRLTLVDPSPAAYDYLGWGIAGIDDVDGDEVPDIAVGQHRGDDTASDGGAVLLFSGADGSLIRRLVDPLAYAADYLGWAIAPIDDLDGDSVADLAVSARNRPPAGGYEVGEILAFSPASGAVLWRGVDPDAVTRDYVGWSLAATPDADGDGVGDLLVGVPYGDLPDAASTGRAVWLSGVDGSWLRTFRHPDPRANDLVGFAAVSPGDLNGDGAPDVAIGASHDDIPKHGADRGSVLFEYPESDCDADGAGPTGADCDDTRAAVHDGAAEICDGLDDDCDGAVDEDEDGDGYDVCEELAACGPEADPWYDRGIHPGAVERCNGLDDDCDGSVDEGPDADGDLVPWPCDCDDADNAVHPGATEVCNHVPDVCGAVDDGFPQRTTVETHVDRLAGAGERFGWSLAGIGDVDGDDVPDFAVSAPWDQTNGAGAGLVTVYSGADRSVWCRSSEAIGSYLGTVVAGTGDWDGDGTPDVAASIPGSNGAVVLSGADCLEIARCVESVPGSWSLGSERGMAAGVDLDGDGIGEILLGSSVNVEREHHQGKAVAFRYDRSTGTCAALFPMWDPDGVTYDNLGVSIAFVDDLDGDGTPDVAVGEPGDDSLADGNGAVLLFSGTDGSFLHRLLDPGGGARHYLGLSVSGLGDVDGDGVGDVAAGTRADRVVLFSGRTGAKIRSLSDPSGTAGERLGEAMIGVGDVDGDGVDDILAGAAYADVGGVVDAGRAVVFGTVTGTVVRRIARDPNATSNLFGYAVGRLGDVSGDGVPELLVGAPYADADGCVDCGSHSVIAAESECDGDDVTPFGGDCDDGDIDLWSLPGEARDVRFTSATTLAWLPPLDPGTGSGALAYDTLRTSDPQAFDAAECVETDGSDTSSTDPVVPPVGEGYYYLVRAANACGEGEIGAWGIERWPRTACACP